MCETYHACFCYLFIFFYIGLGYGIEAICERGCIWVFCGHEECFGHSFIEQRQADVCVQQRHQVDSALLSIIDLGTEQAVLIAAFP